MSPFHTAQIANEFRLLLAASLPFYRRVQNSMRGKMSQKLIVDTYYKVKQNADSWITAGTRNNVPYFSVEKSIPFNGSSTSLTE